MYDIAVALSVVLSFGLYEGFGLLTGGMVSAGYLCLFLEEPLRIVTTLLLAVIVHGLVLLISRATILYSRRRFMVTMLLSLIFAWIIEQALLRMALIPQDIRIIGHVVPGLIANDMYKQGVFKTLLGVLTSAAIAGCWSWWWLRYEQAEISAVPRAGGARDALPAARAGGGAVRRVSDAGDEKEDGAALRADTAQGRRADGGGGAGAL